MKNIRLNCSKIYIILCISFFAICSCNSKSQLNAIIETINKGCPIQLGITGEITTVKYEQEKISFHCLCNDEFVKISSMKENPSVLKKSMKTMLTNSPKEIIELVDIMIEAKAGLEFVWQGRNTEEETSIYLSHAELKELIESDKAPSITDLEKLQSQIDVANIHFPIQIDNATIIEKMLLNNDTVIYQYKIKEDIVSIELLKQNNENIRFATKQNLTNAKKQDTTIKTLLELCVKCNKKLSYQYTGDSSGETFGYTYGVNELKDMLNDALN